MANMATSSMTWLAPWCVTGFCAVVVWWCLDYYFNRTIMSRTLSLFCRQEPVGRDTRPNEPEKEKKKEIFVCPFSNESTFVQESAEHLPLSPMDLYSDWTDHLATRWLVAGISGQDVPGMLRAGLQKLRNSQHFLMEDFRLAYELGVKKKNLDDPERHKEVFVMEDESLEAQRETLELLIAYLPQRYPDWYTYHQQQHSLTVHPIGTTFDLQDPCWQARPLELCARILQEDLVLMRPGPTLDNNHKQQKLYSKEGYYMAAAAVQFSFEDLPPKLGQPLEFIHAPVPGYEKHLRRTMNLLFSNLKADQPPMWRTTWDIHPTGILDHVKTKTYQHVDYETASQVRSSKLHLKVEYQTIRRLPRSHYLLFTIKTMMDPLRSLEAVSPTAAACLAASIKGRSPAMQTYKGLPNATTTQAVLSYLDGIACGTPTK